MCCYIPARETMEQTKEEAWKAWYEARAEGHVCAWGIFSIEEWMEPDTTLPEED
jgi:hypothetical protein